MRVVCVSSVSDSLPSASYDRHYEITDKTSFPITPDKSYVVFGVTQRLGLPWYYIIDDYDLAWPTWVPASLFTVSDGGIPDGWHFGFFVLSRESQVSILSFPEWASDFYFYERLLDDDPEALGVFAKRRAEIEAFDSRNLGGEPE